MNRPLTNALATAAVVTVLYAMLGKDHIVASCDMNRIHVHKIRDASSLKWLCAECTSILESGKFDANSPDIVIEKKYLIRRTEIVPTILPILSAIAVLIMGCLEIAWH